MIQKRKIIGGVLAVGAVVGAYFGGWFEKFGTGTGIGTGTGTSISPDAGAKPANAATKTPDATAKSNAPKKPAESKSKTAAAKSTPTDEKQPAADARNDVKGKLPDKLPCLEVFVRGSRYQIKDLHGTEMLYIKTDSILTLAKRTTGNDEGVRVRISRYRSAKYVAYSQLQAELEQAGLKPDQIRMPKELIDDPVVPMEPSKS